MELLSVRPGSLLTISHEGGGDLWRARLGVNPPVSSLYTHFFSRSSRVRHTRGISVA